MAYDEVLASAITEIATLRERLAEVERVNAGLHDEVQFMRGAAKYNREQAEAAEEANKRLRAETIECLALIEDVFERDGGMHSFALAEIILRLRSLASETAGGEPQ